MARQSKAGLTKIGPRSKGKKVTRQTLGTVRRTVSKGKCSKGQLRTAIVFSQLLQSSDYIMETTWDWLLTKEGTNMYADIYFPKHNLVIEYHGQQHYIFPNFFHKTRKEFDLAQSRDKLKKKLIKQHKIKFIEWRFDETVTEEKALLKLIRAGFPKNTLRKPDTSRRKKRSKLITRVRPRTR